MHRDIKPSNVLVDRARGAWCCSTSAWSPTSSDAPGDERRPRRRHRSLHGARAGRGDAGRARGRLVLGRRACSTRRSPAACPSRARRSRCCCRSSAREPPPPRALVPDVPRRSRRALHRRCCASTRARARRRARCCARLGAPATPPRWRRAPRETPFVGRARGAGGARRPRSSATRAGARGDRARRRRVGRRQERAGAPLRRRARARRRARWCCRPLLRARERCPTRRVDGVDRRAQRATWPRCRRPRSAALLPARAGLLARGVPGACAASRRSRRRRVRAPSALDPQELRARAVRGAARAAGAARARARRWCSSSTICSGPTPTAWRCSREFLRPPDAPRCCSLATCARAASDAPRVALVAARARRAAAARARCRPTRRARSRPSCWRAGRRARRAAPPTRIADEAGGHPLFIDELVRHALPARRERGAPLHSRTRCGRASRRLDAGARAARAGRGRRRAARAGGGGARGRRSTSPSFAAARGAAARRATWCAPAARGADDRSSRITTACARRSLAHSHRAERAARAPSGSRSALEARRRAPIPRRSRPTGAAPATTTGARPTRRQAAAARAERARVRSRGALYRQTLELMRPPGADDVPSCSCASATRSRNAAAAPRRRAPISSAAERCRARRGARAAPPRRRAAPAHRPHRRGPRRRWRRCSPRSGCALPATPRARSCRCSGGARALRLRGLGFTRARGGSELPPTMLARIDICWSVGGRPRHGRHHPRRRFPGAPSAARARGRRAVAVARALALEACLTRCSAPAAWRAPPARGRGGEDRRRGRRRARDRPGGGGARDRPALRALARRRPLRRGRAHLSRALHRRGLGAGDGEPVAQLQPGAARRAHRLAKT